MALQNSPQPLLAQEAPVRLLSRPGNEQGRLGKPLIGVNVATYWLALRRLGIKDALPGMGLLAEKY